MSSPPLHEREKEQWDRTGWCVLEAIIPEGDLAAAQGDLRRFFPSAAAFAADVDPERNLQFRTASDAVLPKFPFDSDAVNGLVLHDSLVDLAEEFLESRDIRLYQGLLSAKYSDGAPDYEQLLHADYGNHTLVVPRHDVGFQQLEMFVYLSDVSPETAATPPRGSEAAVLSLPAMESPAPRAGAPGPGCGAAESAEAPPRGTAPPPAAGEPLASATSSSRVGTRAGFRALGELSAAGEDEACPLTAKTSPGLPCDLPL